MLNRWNLSGLVRLWNRRTLFYYYVAKMIELFSSFYSSSRRSFHFNACASRRRAATKKKNDFAKNETYHDFTLVLLFSAPFKTDTLGVFAVVRIRVWLFLVSPAVSVWFQTHLILLNRGAFVFLLSYYSAAIIRSRVNEVCIYVRCMLQIKRCPG